MRLTTLLIGLVATSLSAGLAVAQEPVPAPIKGKMSKAQRLERIKAAHDARQDARREGRVIDAKIKKAQKDAKENYKSAARKGPKLNPLPGVKKPAKRDFEGEREGRMRPTVKPTAVPALKHPLPGRVEMRRKLPTNLQRLPKALPRVRGGGAAIPKRPAKSKVTKGNVTFQRKAAASAGVTRADLAKRSKLRATLENQKHASRIARLDRLSELAKSNDDKALQTQVETMRKMELARFKKATGK